MESSPLAAAIAIARSVRPLLGTAGSLRVDEELLPTRYLHVVFTLPHRLAPLVLQNKKVLYGLLFRTSAETLLEAARDPRHLGAEIGFFSVLHTWSQQLKIHPHVHCVVPAGGLSLDHSRWVRSRDNYFFPKGCCVKSFAASLSMRSNRLFTMASSASREI